VDETIVECLRQIRQFNIEVEKGRLSLKNALFCKFSSLLREVGLVRPHHLLRHPRNLWMKQLSNVGDLTPCQYEGVQQHLKPRHRFGHFSEKLRSIFVVPENRATFVSSCREVVPTPRPLDP
jgi:hypothetical protein